MLLSGLILRVACNNLRGVFAARAPRISVQNPTAHRSVTICAVLITASIVAVRGPPRSWLNNFDYSDALFRDG
jgi:hypothetical protein